MPKPRRHRSRRILDVALTVASAPVWAPLLAAGAGLVALDSGRPMFFCQTRVGRHGQPFTMIKFRTMVTGDNPLVPDVDRITRAGRWLRRTSLDELPQLLNVLRGEMSLVGPRPILPAQLARLTPTQRRRHLVRPGMTGLSQVNGRNGIEWATRFELDLAWAERPTAARYLALLARTASVVVSGQGVDGHDSNDPVVVDLETAGSTTVDLTGPDEKIGVGRAEAPF